MKVCWGAGRLTRVMLDALLYSALTVPLECLSEYYPRIKQNMKLNHSCMKQ